MKYFNFRSKIQLDHPLLTNKLGIFCAAGSFLVISGLFAAFVAFPALVDWQIDVNYNLANEESEGFRNFVS